jgi:hypothetical protein
MGRPRAPNSSAAVIELTRAELRSTIQDVAVRLGLPRERDRVINEDFKSKGKFRETSPVETDGRMESRPYKSPEQPKCNISPVSSQESFADVQLFL